MMTRQEYLATAYADKTAHSIFYGQAVTPSIVSHVVSIVGADRLKASTDPHMNDIPLIIWDRMEAWLRPVAVRFNEATGSGRQASLSDCVCIAKEAARQWKATQ